MKIKIYRLNNDFLYIAIVFSIIREVAMKSLLFENLFYVVNVIRVISVILFIATIIKIKYPKRTLILLLVILLLSFFSGIRSGVTSGSFTIFNTILFCMACYGCDINSVIHICYSYELVILIAHSLISVFLYLGGNLSLIGVVQESSFYITLGFNNPNVLAAFIFNLIFMYCWLNYEKLDRKKYFIVLLSIIIGSFLTSSRVFSAEGLFLIVLLLISQKTRNGNGFLVNLATFIFPILQLVILFVVSHYSPNGIIMALNRFLTGRISFGAYVYKNYGITLLGQNLSDISLKWDNFYHVSGFRLDSIFMNLPLEYGLVWSIIIAISLIKIRKYNSNKLSVFALIWCIYGIVESYGLNVVFDFYPLIIVYSLISLAQTDLYMKSEEH